MTQVRYEKINGKLKSVAGGANATSSSSSSSSSPLVPMPDEAVKEAAAEIFQRPRLTNRERLAVECLKPRSFNESWRQIQTVRDSDSMQIPGALRSVPEAQVRPPEVDGRVEDEEVPARLGLLRTQASLNEIEVGL